LTCWINPELGWSDKNPVEIFFFHIYFFSCLEIFFHIFHLVTNSFQSSLYKYEKNVLFFQCGIWKLLIYILYVHKKKVMFFQCEIKKTFFV
jgi:hypothetical protein